MKKYLLANWKSHKTLSEATAWLDTFRAVYAPDPQVEVILAPPVVYLHPLHEKLQQYHMDHVVFAAQDISPFPLGAYTGAIAGEMLGDFVEYAIVGHSERRRYFHETRQEVANKVSEAKAAGIVPIVFVDRSYVRSQLAAIPDDINDLIIGYGPVEAIGINIPQSPAAIREAVGEIGEIAPGKPILYGGSINKDNAADYLNIAGISGLMVGTASLDPQEFAAICAIASQA